MTLMMGKPLALLLGFFLLSGGEDFAEGVRYFKEGRYEKAHALLLQAEKAYGKDELPTALLVDLTLTASKTYRFDVAEGYAERAAARDKALGYLRDQVVGAARFAAAGEASKAKDPKKLDEALTEIRRAVEAFSSAILARPEALEPRRNLERALKLEKELEKRKKEAEDKKKKEDEKKKNDKKSDKDKQDKKQKDKDKQDKKQKDKDKQDKKQKDKDKQDKKQKDKDKQDKKQKDQQKKDDKKQNGKPKDSKPKKGEKQKKPMQLSPEEKKRLQEVLKEYQKALMKLKKSRIPRHQPGKKDW